MAQSTNDLALPAQKEVAAAISQHPEEDHMGVTQAKRIFFWIAAGLAWAIWALAVTAAGHDEWLVTGSGDDIGCEGGLGPGDGFWFDVCDSIDDFDDDFADEFDTLCGLYRGFTAGQFIATGVCSVAVALLAVAAFRPAVAGRASVKPLVTAGGVLLIVFYVVQVVAAVLAYFLLEEFDYVFNEMLSASTSTSAIDFELGLTFWLVVAALLLALFISAALLLSAKHAGNGPLNGCGCFWIAVGFAWMTWPLAVAAAAHDEWLIASIPDSAVSCEGRIGPGESRWFDICDAHEDDIANEFDPLCELYLGFTWVQFIATVVCSTAVALLAVAAFRPAVASCASVKPLAIAGGGLTFLYAVSQLAAVVLGYLVMREFDYVDNEVLSSFVLTEGDLYTFKLGLTFWLGVSGVVLASFTSVLLLVNVKHAGTGPLYCCGGAAGGNAKNGQTAHNV